MYLQMAFLQTLSIGCVLAQFVAERDAKHFLKKRAAAWENLRECRNPKHRNVFKKDILLGFFNAKSDSLYHWRVRPLSQLHSYKDATYRFPEVLNKAPDIFTASSKIFECYSRHHETECSLFGLCYHFDDESIRMDNELVSLHWAYYHCHRNIDPETNCAHPCNSSPCVGMKNANGNCEAFFNASVRLNIHLSYAYLLKKQFQYDYKCFCKRGFYWDNYDKQCKEEPVTCKTHPCKNDGECSVLNGKRVCACTPAFSGNDCEVWENPCFMEENKKVCGEFQCQRDALSTTGFSCTCEAKMNFKAISKYNPKCKAINRCKIYRDTCLNGGKCLESNVSFYECECTPDYAGHYCQTRITEIESKWSPWGPHSACSVPCGHGYKIAYRSCSIPYACVGSDSNFKPCYTGHCMNYMSPDESYQVPEYIMPNSSLLTAPIENVLDSSSFQLYVRNKKAEKEFLREKRNNSAFCQAVTALYSSLFLFIQLIYINYTRVA